MSVYNIGNDGNDFKGDNGQIYRIQGHFSIRRKGAQTGIKD